MDEKTLSLPDNFEAKITKIPLRSNPTRYPFFGNHK